MRRYRRVLALFAALLTAVCIAGCGEETDTITNPVPEGHNEAEEPVGLIGFESPEPDGFTFEIMPDADDNIYKMTVTYRLGDEAWGSEDMVTEDGTFFGIDDVVMKVFRLEDLGTDDEVPPMTLSFTFTDAAGVETPAKNEYTVDSPQVEARYLVRITGSQEAGYELSDQ